MDNELSKLSISLTYRIDWLEKLKRRLIPLIERNLPKYKEQSDILDQEFLDGYEFCDNIEENFVDKNQRYFSAKKLYNFLYYNFTNVNVMDAISCYLRSYTEDYFTIFDSFLNNMRVGHESGFGVALKSNFLYSSKEQPLVIKYSKNSKLDNLTHELVMGMIMNEMRGYLPNFIYTIGGFRCNEPILLNHAAAGLCYREGGEQHILLERIHVGDNSYDFITEYSLADGLNFICQVLLSLDSAYQRMRFVHRDLHGANVLRRDIRDESQIDYGGIFIRTFYIATIIDYGMSQAELNGNTYFSQNFLREHKLGNNENDILQANNVYDINMFVMSVAMAIISQSKKFVEYRDDLLELAEILFTIFAPLEDFYKFSAMFDEFPRRKPEIRAIRGYFLRIFPRKEDFPQLGRKIVQYLREKFPSEFATFYSETTWPNIPIINNQPRSFFGRSTALRNLIDYNNVPKVNQFVELNMADQETDKKYARLVLKKNSLNSYIQEYLSFLSDIKKITIRNFLDMNVNEATNAVKYLIKAFDNILHMYNTASAMQSIMEEYYIKDISAQSKINFVINQYEKIKRMEEITNILLYKFVGVEKDVNIAESEREVYRKYRKLVEKMDDMYQTIVNDGSEE